MATYLLRCYPPALKLSFATIKQRYPLCKPGSEKDTQHVILDVTGSEVSYEVGDNIGIFPRVDSVVSNKISTFLNRNNGEAIRVYDEKELLTEFLKAKEIEKCGQMTPHALCSLLQPFPPRFYSISSSQKMVGEEIHLTISGTSYLFHQSNPNNSLANYLCKTAPLGDKILFFISPHNGFSLPEPDRSIIMIGPGSGVAPFRAFMQERLVTSAPGKNWLFFGERNRVTDFLYEDFWRHLEEEGKLYVDAAFSCNQSYKLYVQHLMLAKGKKLFQWIHQGAYIFICGNARNMAKDTEKALLSIIGTHGNMPQEKAWEYLQKLHQEKRYLLNVY